MEGAPAMRDAGEHELMVARIEHEREAREALEAQRQELLKEKKERVAENAKRKEELASLDESLEKFIDVAKPIQKIFEEH